MQRSPPQTDLHVPGAPAVLPVLVGRGGVELWIPQVSDGREGKSSADPHRWITLLTEVSLGNLQQVVLVTAGVLAVLDLFLPPL